MSRYPGPPTNAQGQPLSSAGGYSGHMSNPQTVPPYNVAVASPSQYVQQPGPGPSPTQGHYAHPSVNESSSEVVREKKKPVSYVASTTYDDCAGLWTADDAWNDATATTATTTTATAAAAAAATASDASSTTTAAAASTTATTSWSTTG